MFPQIDNTHFFGLYDNQNNRGIMKKGKFLNTFLWTWGFTLVIGFFAWGILEEEIVRNHLEKVVLIERVMPFYVIALISYGLGAALRFFWWKTMPVCPKCKSLLICKSCNLIVTDIEESGE